MKTLRAYKIRDRNTGMYSLGGSHNPRFGLKGKTWNSMGAINNHLTQFSEIPASWEVVQYELVVQEGTSVSARKFFADRPSLKRKEIRAQRLREERELRDKLAKEALGKLTGEEARALGLHK